MSHRTNSIIACLAMITLVIASHTPATAQDQGTASLAELLNLEFKGGTAADFVETIRRSTAAANVVVLADLSKVTVPAVTLKSVDPATALDLLESLPRQQGDRMIALKVFQDQVSSNHQNHQGQWPVFTITAETADSRRSEFQDSLVLQVGDVLDDQLKAADMLTAVEAALAMLEPEFPAAQMKFHEATALLIARGHPQQMECAQRVVQQLRERKMLSEQSLRTQLQQLQNAASESESNKQAAAELHMRAEMLESKLQMLQEELQRVARRAENAENERNEMSRQMMNMAEELKKAKGG